MKQCLLLLSACLLAGCGARPSGTGGPRQRVVTFSPALTQLVFDMGLGHHVVGVTSYCRLPPGEARPAVGNQLNVRVEPILGVRPDLILTQTAPRHFEPIQRAARSIRVETIRIETLADIAAAMRRIGELTGESERGREAARAFTARLERLGERTRGLAKRRVLFVMGYENPASCGSGTFIHDMIGLAGGVNVMGDARGWLGPDAETLVVAAPEVVVCQCKAWQQESAARYWTRMLTRPGGPPVRTVTVADERWTIPGTHLGALAETMADMVHPEAKS